MSNETQYIVQFQSVVSGDWEDAALEYFLLGSVTTTSPLAGYFRRLLNGRDVTPARGFAAMDEGLAALLACRAQRPSRQFRLIARVPAPTDTVVA